MKRTPTAFLGILLIFIFAFFVASVPATRADSVGPITFESPTYTIGLINGVDGWMALGASGSGCAVYDEGVASSLGTAGFGNQSFRISDAVTSGCFGDQAFAKPLNDSAGETASTNGTFSPGTKQPHFEMQFDIASTKPDQQPGMHLSVSPDRGDGSRMSYLRFNDSTNGVDVYFDDVQQSAACSPSGCANFVETKVGTISRTPHTIKLTMDFFDGPGNDVVKVFIDGILVHTGTSWEDYYRYDPESATEQSPRIVKTVEFRESGTANPANSGNGFLIDNLSLTSGPIPSVVLPLIAPVIITPPNGSILTTAELAKIDWTDSAGGVPPIVYQYEAYSDPSYTALVYGSGPTLGSSEIPTPSTPSGVYYVRVRAQDSLNSQSDWSNGASNPYKIVVDNNSPAPAASCPNGTTQSATSLETVNVNSNSSTPSQSLNILANGKPYLFVASGTWQNSSLNVADAEFASTNGWLNHMDGYDLAPFFLGAEEFDLQVNGAFINWGSYNTSHTYSYQFTGMGGTANFMVFDGDSTPATPILHPEWYGDNSGSLKVDIYSCIPNVVPPKMGSIKIIKQTDNGDGTFSFTGNLKKFVIKTENKKGSKEFSNLESGVYVITEPAQKGWNLKSISCEDPTGDSKTNNRNAVIKLAAGENVTCTFTNVRSNKHNNKDQ